METIKINDKTFVIKKSNNPNKYAICKKCLFYHGNNYPNSEYYCLMTKCYDFDVIREVKPNLIQRIRLWFKKKINK